MRTAVLAVLVLLASSSAFATTLVVPDKYAVIQSAVDAAAPGDTILLRPGWYAGAGNTDVDFGGVNLTLLGEAGAALTVVDCSGLTRALYFHSGEDTTSVIAGLTFRDGAGERGGAARCEGSSPKFLSCVFSDNNADDAGAAVSLLNSDSVFRDCSFLDNSVLIMGFEHGGAGIHCDASSPLISSCTFRRGSSSSGGGVYCIYGAAPLIKDCSFDSNSAYAVNGGAVYCYEGATPTITDCSFVGNTSNRSGGAIHGDNSSPAVVGCTFADNEAFGVDAAWGGGAMCFAGGAPEISGCKFTDNVAERGGGIACREDASPTISGCLFQGGSATIGGGVYFWESGTVWVTDSEFTAGEAISGGGAYSEDSALHLADCVFHWNDATGTDTYHGGGAIHICGGSLVAAGCTIAYCSAARGGGIYVREYGSAHVSSCTVVDCTGLPAAGFYLDDSSLVMEHSIIARSSGTSAVGVGVAGATVSCSDIWGNSGGNWVGPFDGMLATPGNIEENPRFCGGSDVYEAYQLREDSPCAAANSTCGLIGAWGVGCSATMVEPASWGRIKATYR